MVNELEKKMIELDFEIPPIVEAIIYIKTIFPKDISIDTFSAFSKRIMERFPEKKEFRFLKGEVALENDIPPQISSSTGVHGLNYHSQDNAKVVQVKFDGFSFNKLKPYQSWELFSKEASEVWKEFVELTGPLEVRKIGLRYINRFDLPLPKIDFSDYFLSFLNIPQELPQTISNFFLRYEIPFFAENSLATVIQTIGNPTEHQALPFIFDIDVSKTLVCKPNSDKIFPEFDTLRVVKNLIFSASLTPKAKELVK